MAMPEATVGLGRSVQRRVTGLIGQYGLLVLLAIIVLGPIFYTVLMALSPPFQYVQAGHPLHPVGVAWKDRTWFTGGFWSVSLRSLVLVAGLAWIQKVASGVGWKDPAGVRAPKRLVSIVGGAVAVALATGPVFQSLYERDGASLRWFLLAMAVVALTQVPGFLDSTRRPAWLAVVQAVLTGIVAVGLTVLAVGPVVWTQSWSSASLGPAMRRSLVMAVLITVLQVVTSICAAYAFVFLRFPFKRILFAVFMGTLLLPLEVTLVGNVALIRQLDWTNTYQALVLPFAASALGTFLIRQGFRGIPPEIQDATRLDGYGHLSFLTKFAVPLTRPVIASFTVISALQAWNQYLWPRSVIDDDQFNTLQIQLRSAIGANIAQANVTVGAALVAAIPVVIVLVAFQRQIIRGLTAGAVK